MKHYRDTMELEEAIANQMIYDDSVNNRKYEFIRTFIKHLNDAKMYKGPYSVDSNETFVIDVPDKYKNIADIWVVTPTVEDMDDVYDKVIHGYVNEFITIRVLRPRSYGCRFMVRLGYYSYIIWKDDPIYLSTESKRIQKIFQKSKSPKNVY